MAKKRRLITRRRLKWAGIAGTVGIGVLWVVAAFAALGYQHHREEQMLNYSIALWNGRMELRRYDPSRLSATWWWETRSWMDWHGKGKFDFSPEIYWSGRSLAVLIPLWLPLLLIAAPTAWLWRTDRRAKPWQCAKCRYDLRGLEGGVCPECGATK